MDYQTVGHSCPLAVAMTAARLTWPRYGIVVMDRQMPKPLAAFDDVEVFCVQERLCTLLRYPSTPGT